jgi:D-alanine-D-alanine ligase-like ATP-grasp enzyme
MDYIINEKGIAYLIEINSLPGMSKESIVPQMLFEKEINIMNRLF